MAKSAKKSLVVVESPAKAETINKYLGNEYVVLASYGHIRDLPPKNGSVDPEHGFSMVWSIDAKAQKRVDDLAKVAKQAERVMLATDPDREGEAISWHVHEVLKSAGALDGVDVKRVVFNEITKTAILKAMEEPREIDQSLVDAYMARRALDYLVGFTLSPVLWRKLPGCRSAGRVQSVALRIICDREAEIEAFVPQEYWSIEAQFKTAEGKMFTARLVELGGEKIDRLGVANEAMANEAVQRIERNAFSVQSIENKTVRRNPYPPFITSTLQQEASRKLGFGATRTMRTAQQLYEGVQLGGEKVGLITYMRTDGVTLSQEAVSAIRQLIGQQFGDKYLPESPRTYKSKSKNAQEAHEAIRPTDVFRAPAQVRPYLDDDQFRLYELIWKRAVACQMENAVLDQASIDIAPANKEVVLRATGSVLVFDGFLKLYQETREDSSDSEKTEKTGDADPAEQDQKLPKMNEGEALNRQGVDSEQHFTKPPPRYTEASLVKKLEELSIGRPSTYASIIRILQERTYVRMDSRRFIPEDRGRLVTTFLASFFPKYVEYDFTAKLEDELDDIADSRQEYRQVLGDFWGPFKTAVAGTKDLTITQVLDTLDDILGPHFFQPTEDGSDPRECPLCKTGRLGLKLGKFGAFIGCARYKEGCKYTRQLKMEEGAAGAEGDPTLSGPAELGADPATNKMVYLCKGPYGYYVQLGSAEDEADAPPETPAPEPVAEEVDETGTGKKKKTKAKAKAKKAAKPKPKRASLPRGMAPADVTLETALNLLTLPKEIGTHPETGESVAVGIGRFGPYIKFGPTYVSVKPPDDILELSLDRAIEIIAKSGKKTIQLGEHKKKPVNVQKGRFGFYISYNKMNIGLPKGTDPESVTLEKAVELIEAKLAKGETPTAAPAKKRRTAAKAKG